MPSRIWWKQKADENTCDAHSFTAFAIMLANLGYKIALVPYSQSNFWTSLAEDTNAARPGTVDEVYLQYYAGGSGNSPGTLMGYLRYHKKWPFSFLIT